MMIMMRRFWVHIFSLAFLVCAMAMPCHIHAQTTPSPQEIQQARAMLKEKGISEEELKARMLEKGYDLDNLDSSQIEEVQPVLLQTISELEAEKEDAVQEEVQESLDEISSESAESIEKSVEEGASLKEAVSEELQEASKIEQLPAHVYGHHLFRGKDVKVFRQADEVKPPPTYVLGTGDELTIFINGTSLVEQNVSISDRGYISLPGKPSIALRGLTMERAEDILRRRLKQYYVYEDNQFELIVRTARTITVNLYGEVQTVGSITLSAVNTLFNALVAAGGPTNIGSVRKIRRIRGDDVKIFDTYQFMQDPQVAEEFYLQENDYIQVPVAKKVVAIRGAVKRPFRYELLEHENLKQLIDYAGGVEDEAYLRDIQITRFQDDEKVVVNINLREILDSEGDYLLRSGDEVLVQRIEDAIDNYVEVNGAVIKPGRYERRPGMRISNLVGQSVLDDDARLDFGYMLRYNTNGKYTYMRIDPQNALDNPGGSADLVLQDRDIVHIPSLATYSDEVFVEVRGAVRAPGTYNFDPAGVLSVRDALLISGGLIPSASEFGYIVRQDMRDPTRTEYLPFNAQRAAENSNSPDNLILMPYDSIFVFDKRDIEDQFYVRVSGAVRSPGQFSYDTDLTLLQALKLAGGLTFSAATNRIDIARVIIQENEPTQIASYTANVSRDLSFVTGDSTLQLLPFDHIIVRDVPEFELQRNVTISGEVRYPGIYPIISDNERLSSFIERAGGLTQEAFAGGARLERPQENIGVVVIDLKEALRRPNSTANLVLQNNDRISIPKVQELVTITGAVNLGDLYRDEFIQGGNKINVTYEEGKNARYYINNYAAGIADRGRWRLVTVEHANGRIEKTVNLGLFKIYPKVTEGSTVRVGVVPEKVEEPREAREEVDWGQIVRDSLAQATAILTLILLLERLN